MSVGGFFSEINKLDRGVLPQVSGREIRLDRRILGFSRAPSGSTSPALTENSPRNGQLKSTSPLPFSGTFPQIHE